MQNRPGRLFENNPFLVRDRKRQAQGIDENHSLLVANRMECDDAKCRATHAGHHPFRHSVSYLKHQSKQNERTLDRSSASKQPLQAKIFKKYGASTSLLPGKTDIIHRHHSAGFHSRRHIADHLSSAVGHSAYDILKDHNKKKNRHVSPKKPSPHLKPLTKPESVAQLSSFHWTPDTVPPGHPSRSKNSKQKHSPATKAPTSALDHCVLGAMNRKSPHEARDTMSEKDRKSEIHNGSSLSLYDDSPPKLLLASTPSWLKNPTRTADAAALLHHIDVKSHHAREHGHSYLSNVPIGGREGQGEQHLSSTRMHDSRPIMPKVLKPLQMMPKIRIDPPERERRDIPMSVSKRREIFEHVQEHTNVSSLANTASYRRSENAIRKASAQGQQQGATSITQSRLQQPLIEG
ncbi:hypothetical protein ANO14919_141220 [Xylariales sp. No.14919]|nr:hypothetical protein ANO14919_141220 [Xylariales sp. No.14919]